MDNQKKAYIYALCAVLLWSTVATAFKLALQYFKFIDLLFVSSLVSLIVLFIILIYQKKISLLKQFSIREYFLSAALGFLNPFLYYIILFRAYSLLPAQEAQTLNYTWAIMVVILSIPLLKQKIAFKGLAAIFISFFGAIIIACKGNFRSFEFSDTLGVLLALGSSVIWALFWILNLKDKRDEIVKLFLNFLFGFIFIFIFSLSTGSINITNHQGFFYSVYVGVFEMGITFVLWLKAIKLSGTTAQVSNFIYLSPFISLIFINFVLDEKINGSTIVGLVLISAGIIIQQLKIKTK